MHESLPDSQPANEGASLLQRIVDAHLVSGVAQVEVSAAAAAAALAAGPLGAVGADGHI